MAGLSSPSEALRQHQHLAASLAASYAACKAITAHHARSFYYASPLLPPAKRRAAYAVYAFCRVADDTVDRAAEIGDAAAVRAALDQMTALLDAAYAPARGAAPDAAHPAWLPAFADTVQRFAIPRTVFADLLDGVRMDLQVQSYRTFEHLLEYCHKVAGVVGLMMTHIFGFRDASILRHAAAMGVAMQLTNIARDVAEDAALGRTYVPAEWLPADPGAAPPTPEALRAVIPRLVDTARRYYQYAYRGVPGITDPLGRLCTLAMGGIYADILLALEQQGCDPFAGRARRSGLQKVGRLLRVVGHLGCWLRQPARLYAPWPRLDGDVDLWWPYRVPSATDIAGPPPGST